MLGSLVSLPGKTIALLTCPTSSAMPFSPSEVSPKT